MRAHHRSRIVATLLSAHRRRGIVAAEGLSATQEGSSPHLAEGSSLPSAAPDCVAPEVHRRQSRAHRCTGKSLSQEVVEPDTLKLVAAPTRNGSSSKQRPRRRSRGFVDFSRGLVAAQDDRRCTRGFIAAQEGSSLNSTRGLVAAQEGSSPHERAHRCAAQEGSSLAAHSSPHRAERGLFVTRQNLLHHSVCGQVTERSLEEGPSPKQRAHHVQAHRRTRGLVDALRTGHD